MSLWGLVFYSFKITLIFTEGKLVHSQTTSSDIHHETPVSSAEVVSSDTRWCNWRCVASDRKAPWKATWKVVRWRRGETLIYSEEKVCSFNLNQNLINTVSIKRCIFTQFERAFILKWQTQNQNVSLNLRKCPVTLTLAQTKNTTYYIK